MTAVRPGSTAPDGARPDLTAPDGATSGPDVPVADVPGAVAEGAESPVRPGPGRVVLDVALRVAGGLVAVALAALSAVVEIFYAPLRIGGVPIGFSVLAAALVNYWLLRFTIAVTRVGWAGLLPPVAWFALMLVAADRTDEGDILLSMNNWVGLAAIFAGSLSFAVAGYRLLLEPPATSHL